MITNKKYLVLSLLFILGLSAHSFDDHDHLNFDETVSECQACEENVDVKVLSSEHKNKISSVSFKTNLFKRFVDNPKKSFVVRAPPFKS